MKTTVIISTMVGAGALSRKKLQIDADDDAPNGDRHRHRQHRAEAADQQEGDGAGRDQQGDGQDQADRLQRGDDGQRQHRQQAVVQHAAPAGRGAGLGGVEGVQQQVAPFQQDRADHAVTAIAIAPSRQVLRADAQHVAEQDVVEMHVGLDLGVKHDAEPEHAGEHHAHHGVLLDPAVVAQIPGRQRAEHAGGEGADDQRQASDIGQHDARQDGVADRIAHQRPALQHQKADSSAVGGATISAIRKRVLHEGELERGQAVDRAHRPPQRGAARRRAARMPCLGAKTKATRNSAVCRQTMTPPVAPSRKIAEHRRRRSW